MKETPRKIQLVEIEEYYSEEEEGIYYNWKLKSDDLWTKQLTPYTKLPFQIFKH